MSSEEPSAEDYRLEEQVGFILRQVSQHHTSIFMANMLPNITPTRFSALVKLDEKGALTQNELGRQTAMDASTIKGVVDNLCQLGYTRTTPDMNDRRRHLVSLTHSGTQTIGRAIPIAKKITDSTLDKLTKCEQATLLKLLIKMR